MLEEEQQRLPALADFAYPDLRSAIQPISFIVAVAIISLDGKITLYDWDQLIFQYLKNGQELANASDRASDHGKRPPWMTRLLRPWLKMMSFTPQHAPDFMSPAAPAA